MKKIFALALAICMLGTTVYAGTPVIAETKNSYEDGFNNRLYKALHKASNATKDINLQKGYLASRQYLLGINDPEVERITSDQYNGKTISEEDKRYIVEYSKKHKDILLRINSLIGLSNVGEEVAFQSAGDLILKPDGTLWGVGHNKNGRLSAEIKEDYIKRPVKIMDNIRYIGGEPKGNWETDRINYEKGYIIAQDNTLYLVEDKITKVMDNVSSVDEDFIVQMDGTLYVWGYCSEIVATLFNLSEREYENPVKVMDNVKQIKSDSALYGDEVVMVLKTDDTLWGMGDNRYASVGDGTRTKRTSLVHIMDDVKEIGCVSWNNTLVIKNDNSIWGWGENAFGAIGGWSKTGPDSREEDAYVVKPKKIIENVQKAYLSWGNCAALTHDGELYVWGCDQFSGFVQIPEGADLNIDPTRLQGNVVDFKAGVFSITALLKGGTVWQYSPNMNFRTGETPTEIGIFGTDKKTQVGQYAYSTPFTEAIGVTADGNRVYALKADGSVWAWGENLVIINEEEEEEENPYPAVFINEGWAKDMNVEELSFADYKSCIEIFENFINVLDKK